MHSELLTLTDWRRAYRDGASPGALIIALRERLQRESPREAWIRLASAAEIEASVATLASLASRHVDRAATLRAMPLFGVPFAVKDNIDVAGLPTTAACPAFARTPSAHAHAVGKLIAAGAVCIGKTNLDQFATGLVGVRSPYGIPRNTFDPAMIPGGSSSGSAVAVAAGLVP
ncbi:MAG: allophanate hydrolase, partial [Rhizobiales bacterium]|nr:allophanate hydrolase [Rhizobacter sp.]